MQMAVGLNHVPQEYSTGMPNLPNVSVSRNWEYEKFLTCNAVFSFAGTDQVVSVGKSFVEYAVEAFRLAHVALCGVGNALLSQAVKVCKVLVLDQ
jgi:hypothetical protein